MFKRQRSLCLVFILVLIWRIALLVFTVQPIPANDAFFFDGAVVNWLHNGPYVNPSLSEAFPISGHQVYAAYPPLYQLAIVIWMSVFGPSVVAAMALHLTLFGLAGVAVVAIIRNFFPVATNTALAGCFFLGITFGDRPEDLAHVLGLTSLWLVLRNLAGKGDWRTTVLILLSVLAALYTSIIEATMYFAIGLIASGVGWWKQRQFRVFLPYLGAAFGFILIAICVAYFKPVYWRGFLENARQTPVMTAGFHLPQPTEVIKLIRNAPVFLLGGALLPWILLRFHSIALEPWFCLCAGIFVTGVGLLVADMILLAPNYVMYVLMVQILLAAGLICLGKTLFPKKSGLISLALVAGVLLISVRAVGLSTWGVACARHNSYEQTHEVLRQELEPFALTDAPVILSSPFLYSALEFGVRHPVHFDWYYDRASKNPDADFQGMIQLRPTKLILTQFDYYRGFLLMEQRLREHPELGQIQVRNDAVVKPPDAIPSLQRVVQHVSWAPVVVELQWQP